MNFVPYFTYYNLNESIFCGTNLGFPLMLAFPIKPSRLNLPLIYDDLQFLTLLVTLDTSIIQTINKSLTLKVDSHIMSVVSFCFCYMFKWFEINKYLRICWIFNTPAEIKQPISFLNYFKIERRGSSCPSKNLKYQLFKTKETLQVLGNL